MHESPNGVCFMKMKKLKNIAATVFVDYEIKCQANILFCFLDFFKDCFYHNKLQ